VGGMRCMSAHSGFVAAKYVALSVAESAKR
jgi:hypothetical protein